jgi:predicted metal-dependent enzyme (double-stranded beta helix superfamily)
MYGFTTMRFDPERFIDDCRIAAAGSDGMQGVQDRVAAAVSEPERIAATLGEPRAGVHPLYRSAELTIIDFAWAPWMSFKPHNHNMWAVVGIVSGREDNIFWRRIADSIEAVSARSLGAGDVSSFGRDVIHSVVNPLGRMTRAIHVYGGDFFEPGQPRSEWNPETLIERPWDMDDTRRLFAEAEARARRRAGE